MKISFIACEYNPFHNGHKYHINKTKSDFSDAVICVMSGNFVQRGDIAVCEKHIRAKSAVMCGADLVIELPIKYATSTAPLFAEGFVKTAVATGLDCNFSFGSGNDISELRLLKNVLHSDEADSFADIRTDKRLSYPDAKAKYAQQILGSGYDEIIKDSNNILSVEYLRAIDTYCPEAGIFALKRNGTSHDSFITSENFASASFIRNNIYNYYDNGENIVGLHLMSDYIPHETSDALLDAYSSGAFPVDRNKFSLSAMSILSQSDKDYFSKINSCNGGLENRFAEKLRNVCDINELADSVKSKRYPHSRIRQIIVQSVLGITRDVIDSGINYIRVLAFNDRGREILHSMKNTSTVPVIMNLSESDRNDPATLKDTQIDYLAGKLMNLCSPHPLSENTEYTIPPIYIK